MIKETEYLIGRENLITQLTSVIRDEYKIEVDESYIVSINAKYGDGKTTFIKI